MAVVVSTDSSDLRDLMVLSLAGDAAAHNRLLTEIAPKLRRFFGGQLRNDSADVEDLVQDTLIVVHTRRASYDPARPFAPWLYAIARYKLVDRYRRLRATVPIDDVAAFLSEGSPENAIGARLDVATLLEALPPKQRAAIHATKIDGLSVAEAADRAGISEADVKVSVHRGLKALMQKLGVG